MDLQRQLILAMERNVQNIDNISSDISRLIKEHSGGNLDDVNSDISELLANK
jgi:hypothetical protein